MSSRTATVVALLLAPATAGAGPKIPSLTPDQLIVVSATVEDTFPRPRHPTGPIVLCLDVRVSDDPPEEAPSAPARGPKRKKARAPEVSVFRGAPPELLTRLARPWRIVASAPSCRLDSRQPFTLEDTRTPAQLVTIHLGAAYVATGAIRIDWTGGTALASGAVNSRDCTATRSPRGWNVRCGGTWTE